MKAALAALLAVFLAQGALAQACREDAVYLKGAWGEARFAIEIADDDAERAQGLMHREHLPSSSGMLFVYDTPQRLSFWMRNTLIPLDLIFIDQTGVVKTVHHSAQPLDETPIPGGPDPLTHVLEINGGLAKAMGIVPGTLVRHPSFPNQIAEWPC
ncbi:hypothetical protein So717_34380 [Roseobacter cerasinus]|uniref:DUF192 domain-containing protein n=1 Tax=Roseobacter cerasinus TaxID=2602289 RepID=A0A640VXK4_9RHOB|nr:DUF192 domain-containing protein [Roseobacter cerasinus]GFE51685.1 hypothetical protein So717_34380 [Roseobacter cerasinus]